METISRLPRRLTQLYCDTKTSCDAVVDQDTPEAQPEVNALHRKYRIQKDRLIAWGLEWSDNTGGIEDSIERAGLTKMVTSVMGTIKSILDEAEEMHPPAAPAAGKILSGEKSGARPTDPPSWAAADRSRYEDLAKDLTTSIDTLYDLSRTRRSHQDGARGKLMSEPLKGHGQPSSVYLSSDALGSEITLINPATLPTSGSVASVSFGTGLPPKLDPADLVLPQEEPPPYESLGVSSSIRVIGQLRSTHSSTNPWKTSGSKCIETRVLVEYATFDPAYRSTEVSPPRDRLDSLLTILARLANEQAFHGTLKCLGYFEDPKQPRFGLIYELPSFVYSGPSESHKQIEELRPVTLLSVLQTGSKSLHNSNSATPALEDRFRLAYTLALTFSKIHGDSFSHKDVNSSNILVFRKSRSQSTNSRALQYALRSPVICSFDLFSEYEIEPMQASMSAPNIYRHPEDPKFTGEKSKEYGPQFDMYGLALILLEIGLWQPISDLWKDKYTLFDFKKRIEDTYIRRLASKCGTAYMQVVRECFSAADQIAPGAESLQDSLQIYNRALIRLQRCCALDEADSSFEWGGEQTVHAASTTGHAPPKGKSVNPQQAETPPSPSTFRSPKRWALDKGSQILERTKSQSKTSPKSSPSLSSLSRSESKSSQHSIRRSISQSLHSLTNSKDDLAHPIPEHLEESGTLVPSTQSTTPVFPDDKGDLSSLYKEQVGDAASVIQRAWRASRDSEPQRSLSFKDYKDKITVIQKLWRERKQRHTIGALIAHQLPATTLGFKAVPYPSPAEKAAFMERSDMNFEIRGIIPAPAPRPKLRVHAVQFPPSIVEEWHTGMLPRLERLIERALKDSEETISIDLVAIGETQAAARPTILVTCASVARVKAVLARRFRYDDGVFDLKVRRGKVRRSKLNRSSRRRGQPHRSMMNTDAYGGDMHVMNPFHQQRPLCGASIGAFRGEHLPPVSYGGVILVDDEPLGMSVHHLLDAPSEDEDSECGEDAPSPHPGDAMLSSATSTSNPWLMGMGAQPGVQIAPDSPAPMWDLEISDDESMKSSDNFEEESYELSSDSEFDSDNESDQELADSITSQRTTGDIDGIPLGGGKSIIVTQPAIDDVADDLFPNEEDRDEDHIVSHELGHVHASSGIRRWKRDGVTHEIDWALLKLDPERLQPYNLIQGGRRYCVNASIEPDQELIKGKLEKPVCRRYYKEEEDEYPNQVASANNLGGVSVHCFGRTSGLQAGIVGAAMSAVRIYRRKTFSRSWHVLGGFGVGGDSGAWVIQNSTHRVCGHVLAWCERNRISYICPMEVLLDDIKRTTGAKRIYLPGSVEETLYRSRKSAGEEIAGKENAKVGAIETGAEGLGIIDSAVDMTKASGARRSRLQLPRLGTSGESDKENQCFVGNRMMIAREGRGSVPIEMVASPLEVGCGSAGLA